MDLEDSFNKFTEELLPKLLSQELPPDEIEDVLHDIGEEFRHILYHIKDPKYFNYITNID